MSPERPDTRATKREQSPDGLNESFGENLDDFQSLVGLDPSVDLPDDPNQKELEEAEMTLRGDGVAEDFSEMFTINELIQRRHALQRLHELKDGKEIDKEELIVINQAVTYYQYFPEILRDIGHTMEQYRALKSDVGTAAMDAEVSSMENQADAFFRAINAALRERIVFSNVLLLNTQFATHSASEADVSALMKKLDALKADPALSQGSKAALNGQPDVIKRQGNILNQKVIDILSGVVQIPGVEKGFSPQKLYLLLLSKAYKKTVADAKSIIGDSMQTEYDSLYTKDQAYGKKEGPPLSNLERERYTEIRAYMDNQNRILDDLQEQRSRITDEIVRVTQDLGRDQLHRTELSTIQHQFGDAFDFTNAYPPNPETTPAHIRDQMAENMDTRSNFHLDRLDAFMTTVEDDVLHVGVIEHVEDASNEYGREVVRRANHVLTNVLTIMLPENFGIKEYVRESISGPLDSALGWPPGKDNWDELTEEEKQQVMEKSKSVLDAIKEFDRSKIDKFQSTVALIRSMPNAESFVGQDVVEPLPADRVTGQNVNELMQRYGGATVYKMLFEQLDADWGSDAPNDGFLGEYGEFLRAVTSNVDVHFDVSKELHSLGDMYMNMRNMLLMAALMGLGVGVIGTTALYKLARPAARLMGRATKGALKLGWKGAKEMGRVTWNTGKKLVELSRKTLPKGAEKLSESAPAMKKGAEIAAKSARFLRLLGPAAVALLTGAKLRSNILRDARLEDLPDMQGVEAALELLYNHPEKEHPRYKDMVNILETRMNALVMMGTAEELLLTLSREYPTNVPAQIEDIMQRAELVLSTARRYNEELHKQLPITEYLKTDPARPTGNVGVNIYIDQAIERGDAYRNDTRDVAKALNGIKADIDDPNAFLKEFRASKNASAPSTDEIAEMLKADIKNTHPDVQRYDELESFYTDLLERTESIMSDK